MPVEDEGVQAFFAKYTTESAASEHFPLMELTGYNCEEKLATGEVLRDVLIKYTKQIESAGQLHKVAVDMHFAAYSELGCA